MKLKVLGLTALLALVGGIFAACGGETHTNNANTRVNANVTNLGANNANTGAIVVNANSTNSNRWANTNVTREEYEKNRTEYERDRGESKIGTGANDSWLWFKTRAALMAADNLRDSTINVDVENDVVTLRGTVENKAQVAEAEKVAKGIEGVKSVKNELKVAPEDSVTNMSSGNSSNTNRR
jgi:osmotically-inducible protein OsmY